jgi:hypothetical protein
VGNLQRSAELSTSPQLLTENSPFLLPILKD